MFRRGSSARYSTESISTATRTTTRTTIGGSTPSTTRSPRSAALPLHIVLQGETAPGGATIVQQQFLPFLVDPQTGEGLGLTVIERQSGQVFAETLDLPTSR